MNAEPAKRRNHWWGPIEKDGWSRCRHCGLAERSMHDWYRGTREGLMVSVIEWAAPTGRVVRIRPVRAVDAPQWNPAAPTVAEAFPGAEIGGVPGCPKEPGHWT